MAYIYTNIESTSLVLIYTWKDPEYTDCTEGYNSIWFNPPTLNFLNWMCSIHSAQNQFHPSWLWQPSPLLIRFISITLTQNTKLLYITLCFRRLLSWYYLSVVLWYVPNQVIRISMLNSSCSINGGGRLGPMGVKSQDSHD